MIVVIRDTAEAELEAILVCDGAPVPVRALSDALKFRVTNALAFAGNPMGAVTSHRDAPRKCVLRLCCFYFFAVRAWRCDSTVWRLPCGICPKMDSGCLSPRHAMLLAGVVKRLLREGGADGHASGRSASEAYWLSSQTPPENPYSAKTYLP